MTDTQQFRPPSIEDREFWTNVQTDARLADAFTRINVLCAEAPKPPTIPLASDFLAATRHNNRSILDHQWNVERNRLAALAIRRLMKGIDADDPDDLLLNTLWAHATQATWVVSAHLPGNDLPSGTHITIDLAAAEMAANLAEICETLKPWMDSVSERLFKRMIYEIDTRVLEPIANGYDDFWLAGHNNWTGVCAGSILAACQSFEAMGMPRPKAKARMLEALGKYLSSGFTEHGECDEGIGYWGYGLSYTFMGLMRLSRDDYEAHVDRVRLREILDYPRRSHLYDDIFFASNDASMENTCHTWLAMAIKNCEDYSWLIQWARFNQKSHLRDFCGWIRTFTLPLEEKSTATQVEQTSPITSLPDQQVMIMRTQTPQGELIGILGGGHNAEMHNHNDIGQFVFILDKEIIIPDLGNKTYTTDFFGPKRYTYLAASSRGHNCPIINGYEQSAGREAAAVVKYSDEVHGYLSIETKMAYPKEAGLVSWVRSMAIDDGYPMNMDNGFLIDNDFETEPSPREIVLRTWSTQKPKELVPSLFSFGPLLGVSFTPNPDSWCVTEVDGSEEELRSFQNKTLYCLDVTYTNVGRGGISVMQTVRPFETPQ